MTKEEALEIIKYKKRTIKTSIRISRIMLVVSAIVIFYSIYTKNITIAVVYIFLMPINWYNTRIQKIELKKIEEKIEE